MNKVFLVVVLLWSSECSGQILLDNTLTPEQLVQNVLLGGGVTASNVTFNGVLNAPIDVQVGSFNGTNCNVGIASGVILATGDIDVALGPNNAAGATLGDGDGQGDPDLDEASNSTTYDRAVLEFDFIPSGDSLEFRYVFGSEEYLEFVNAGYNDAFGFFLSGPDISGPYLNNAANIALIPNSGLPVTIDNLNDLVNSSYYVDNGDGFTQPNSSDEQYIQFDGFTVVLTAKAVVQCGQTYHIKIAIADAGDPILDSGVFIEGGSFTSPNAIDLEIVTASAAGTLTEGCTDAFFTITRPESDSTLTVNIAVSGTAINGTDYTQIPSAFTIPDGQNSISFPVSAFLDGISEGVEEIILTATFINLCGDTSISTASVPILDYVPIDAMTNNLELDCTQDSVSVSVLATGGFGELSYLWNTGDQMASTWLSGLIDGTYSVTITDDCAQSVTEQLDVFSGCEIIIPNVFSPNGDGYNDFFVIDHIESRSNTLNIYNRWGNVVYETRNYRNQWNGRDLPDGTYYYVLQVTDEQEARTGHLTILGHR
ncbi:MAG: choice-of-anchor L domain-containing protein [Flavobacteriales bacterium]|nr:choice-of-anchor L domain-containing protein [Flavobacteriales bacterium]